jgi:hypothetical protein
MTANTTTRGRVLARVTRELPRSTRPSVPSLIVPSPSPPSISPPRPPSMPPPWISPPHPPPHPSPVSPPIRPPRPPPIPMSSASMPATTSRVSLPPTMSHVPPVPATCEPRVPYRSWFTGALLPICDVEVLIVVVQPRVMFDTYEANLFVTAFNLRFKRTIVLLSQDEHALVPTYYGPAGIVRALSMLPFEMIPWQRMLYRIAKPASWILPIPPERPPYPSSVESVDSSVNASIDANIDASRADPAFASARYESLDDLAATRIHDADADDLRALAERIARTTRR